MFRGDARLINHPLGAYSQVECLPEKSGTRVTLLQGTLDLLVLRVLLFGPRHGKAIARAIDNGSHFYT